jgi:hypothetical protein
MSLTFRRADSACWKRPEPSRAARVLQLDAEFLARLEAPVFHDALDPIPGDAEHARLLEGLSGSVRPCAGFADPVKSVVATQ